MAAAEYKKYIKECRENDEDPVDEDEYEVPTNVLEEYAGWLDETKMDEEVEKVLLR